MVDASWGTKRSCRKCGANFYDLNKDPISCPKCLTTYGPNDFISKYAKSSDAKEVKKENKKDHPFDDDVLIDEATLDEEMLEDDDQEDMTDVAIEREESEEDR